MKAKTIFFRAVRYSIPVLLGYMAIGIAFGLLTADAGYPWYLALLMSVVMYAGAGQYMAIALFASGAGLLEMILAQFIVNARHVAYGITMFSKFSVTPRYKPYLIFALTDETFALLSSLDDNADETDEERGLFMFLLSLCNHLYWIGGSVIGALAGALLPFKMTGVDYALNALFIVLLIEQFFRVKRAAPFIISAIAAFLAAALLSKNISLIAALAAALAAAHFLERKTT